MLLPTFSLYSRRANSQHQRRRRVRSGSDVPSRCGYPRSHISAVAERSRQSCLRVQSATDRVRSALLAPVCQPRHRRHQVDAGFVPRPPSKTSLPCSKTPAILYMINTTVSIEYNSIASVILTLNNHIAADIANPRSTRDVNCFRPNPEFSLLARTGPLCPRRARLCAKPARASNAELGAQKKHAQNRATSGRYWLRINANVSSRRPANGLRLPSRDAKTARLIAHAEALKGRRTSKWTKTLTRVARRGSYQSAAGPTNPPVALEYWLFPSTELLVAQKERLHATKPALPGLMPTLQPRLCCGTPRYT